MKNKYLTGLFGAVLLCCGQNLSAAGTNQAMVADVTNLVANINAKLEAGKTQEADFADNFKKFDALLAKYKDATPVDQAHILLLEAELYSDVLDEPEKALEIYKQIKRKFPTVEIEGNTDEAISGLEGLVAQWKIWDALAVGTKFPDFTTNGVDSDALSLTTYKGKVVLIDFWATWCPPCQRELPNLLKVYQAHHGQGFDIIGVSLDSDRNKLVSFLKEKGMTWPQAFDGQGWGGTLVTQYGVHRLPSTFLLDGQGMIIGKNLQGDELERGVARALARK